MTTSFIHPVPFIQGYRAVVTPSGEGSGELMIEHFDDAARLWFPERLFTYRYRLEIMGITTAYAACVRNHIEMDMVIEGLTSRRIFTIGRMQIGISDMGDGRFYAVLEELGKMGESGVIDCNFDARSFFEAYGWALAEAQFTHRRRRLDRQV